MQPRKRTLVVSSIVRAAMVVGILLFPAYDLFAESSSNVICRDELSEVHRDQLVDRLRQITGWSDLAFDSNGQLLPGSTPAIVGSKSARELISRVAYGNQVVVIEDASGRGDVAFSRVVPGAWKNPTRDAPQAYVVQIDFTDFERVIGDPQALQAFHVGWGFLHELDHIANDSNDATPIGTPGECETHINQMRRECDLPLRASYFFTLMPLSRDSAFITKLVRMAFDQEPTGTSKKKRYWLLWDATLVGGLDEQKQIATLR